MKSFKIIAVYCLVLVIYCEAELSDKEKAFFHRYFAECAASLKIPVSVNIENRMEHGQQVVNDAQFKKIVVCLTSRSGLLNPDGSFNKQKLLDVMKDEYDAATITFVVDTCFDSTIKSVEDRLIKYYKCIFAKHFF